MTDQHQATLAALAVEIERLRRQLDAQRAEIARAQQTADHAHRVLIDIIDRVKELADHQANTRTSGGRASSVPVSWLTINDPITARAALDDLVDWLDRVYIHYPGAADSLGECWPWHPAAIEELMALRAGWLAAYTGPDASAIRALDWHDRALPGVQRRLRALLGDCSQAAHRPGGRADQTHPHVPAASAVDKLAEWWATTHGRAAPPTRIAATLGSPES